MRAWKSVKDPAERIFMYLREHADKFMTEDHVAAQVGIGKRRTRKIVHELAGDGKIEAVETVSSSRWGRPKMMFRACRHLGLDDQIRQAEIFSPKRRADLVEGGLNPGTPTPIEVQTELEP